MEEGGAIEWELWSRERTQPQSEKRRLPEEYLCVFSFCVLLSHACAFHYSAAQNIDLGIKESSELVHMGVSSQITKQGRQV